MVHSAPMEHTDVAERYRRVASTFLDRVRGVPEPDGWFRHSPCEGWVARDIVLHLAEWIPPFLESGSDVTFPDRPDPRTDPVGAWTVTSDALQRILDDPATVDRTFDNPHTGSLPLADAIARFVLGDVLVHTWDLARATGQDETLDRAEVLAMVAGLERMDADVLVQSGHYSERAQVGDNADPQTKLLALTGRQP